MRKLGLGVVLLGLLFFSLSCDSPTESKYNPYEQQPIPWPSLADSPWPMYRHDPQGTGRSSLRGPSRGKAYYFSLYPPAVGRIFSQPVVVSNNYLISTEDGYCFDLKDTHLIWQKRFSQDYFNFTSTPLVTEDQTIWLASDTLYNFSLEGKILRKYPLGFKNYSGLTIDKEGYLYMTDSYKQIYKYSQNGEKVWEITAPGQLANWTVPVISPEGGSIYVSGNGIWAINALSGNIEWEWKPDKELFVDYSPSVCNEGLLYFANTIADTLFFTCLNADGSIRWQYRYREESGIPGYSAINHQGNVLQTFGNELLGFSPNGQVIIKYTLKGDVSALSIDNKDNIYFGYSSIEGIECIDSKGNHLWSVDTATGFDTPIVLIGDGMAVCGSSSPRFPNVSSFYIIQ